MASDEELVRFLSAQLGEHSETDLRDHLRAKEGIPDDRIDRAFQEVRRLRERQRRASAPPLIVGACVALALVIGVAALRNRPAAPKAAEPTRADLVDARRREAAQIQERFRSAGVTHRAPEEPAPPSEPDAPAADPHAVVRSKLGEGGVLWQKGVDAYERGDYAQAERRFRECWGIEFSPCMTWLGRMMYEGLGMPADKEKGAKLWTLAMRKGDPYAMAHLGKYYAMDRSERGADVAQGCMLFAMAELRSREVGDGTLTASAAEFWGACKEDLRGDDAMVLARAKRELAKLPEWDMRREFPEVSPR